MIHLGGRDVVPTGQLEQAGTTPFCWTLLLGFAASNLVLELSLLSLAPTRQEVTVPTAMQRMAKTFPRVPRLADAAAVIAASDCTYIASPPASHLEHARAALAAGKSVFSEKPLAVDVADAAAFVAEAGNRGAVPAAEAGRAAVALAATGPAARLALSVPQESRRQ